MYCPHCFKTIPPEQETCPKCGQSLDPPNVPSISYSKIRALTDQRNAKPPFLPYLIGVSIFGILIFFWFKRQNQPEPVPVSKTKNLSEEIVSVGVVLPNPSSPEMTKDEMTEILNQHKEKKFSHYNDGIRYLQQSLYTEAVNQFEKSLAFDPFFSEAKTKLAFSYSALKNYRKALDLYLELHRDNPQAKGLSHNIAACYNNLGIQKINQGDRVGAIGDLKNSIKYDPANFHGYFALGYIYFLLEEYLTALPYLKEAHSLDNTHVEVHNLLGLIYYKQGNLERAINHWQKSANLDPQREDISWRLQKAQKEFSVEKKFVGKTSSQRFVINYEGGESIDISAQILRTLENAHRDIGILLTYHPQEPVQVILYTDKQFTEITNSYDWVGGLYDGKIRLPVKGKIEDKKLEQILYHEYSHVLVYLLSKGHCPVWLNEGLALNLEKGLKQHHLRLMKEAFLNNRYLPLSKMPDNFINIEDEAKVALLYSQSYFLVKYIIERSNFLVLKNLLIHLGNNLSFAEALKKTLYLTIPDFENAFLNQLIKQIS